jgi:hypothetical protein
MAKRKKDSEMAPSEEIGELENIVAEEEKPAAVEEEKPKARVKMTATPPQDIKLTARQFVMSQKYRWHRCAGFVSEMKKNPGLKTRPEWQDLWNAYWSRPVR